MSCDLVVVVDWAPVPLSLLLRGRFVVVILLGQVVALVASAASAAAAGAGCRCRPGGCVSASLLVYVCVRPCLLLFACCVVVAFAFVVAAVVCATAATAALSFAAAAAAETLLLLRLQVKTWQSS